MNTFNKKQEWDFITNETHNGDKENSIKRELLFTMQCELSKPEPNLDFYNGLKVQYLQ